MNVSDLIAFAESEIAALKAAPQYNVGVNEDWEKQLMLDEIALRFLKTMAPLPMPHLVGGQADE